MKNLLYGLLLGLFIIHLGFATDDVLNIQKAIDTLSKKQEDLKHIIDTNEYETRISSEDDGYVPTSKGHPANCKTGIDGKLYCTIKSVNIPPYQIDMQLSGKDKNLTVPQPKQYKNVFKLIATVMYMVAVIYFLIQIAMELYQKKFMQALTMLMMFLIGSSILYIAYRSVFNAP